MEFLEEHYIPRRTKATPLPSTAREHNFQVGDDTSDHWERPSDEVIGHAMDLEDTCSNGSSGLMVTVNPTSQTGLEEAGNEQPTDLLVPGTSQTETADVQTPRASATKKRKCSEPQYGSAIQFIASKLQEDDEDETDLFAKSLAAEIKKINCEKKKRSVKLQLMKVLYELLD